VFTTSLHNYGYIPLPLCDALFDRDTMGVLFAYYLGVELAFWSIAVAQLTDHAERGSWRGALNPPIIAIPTAIFLNAAWIGLFRAAETGDPENTLTDGRGVWAIKWT
jgi:malate permease and related proteins